MSQEYRKKQVIQPEFSENELLIKSLANSKCNKCSGTGRRAFRQAFGFAQKFITICKCVPTSLIYEESNYPTITMPV